MHISRAAISHSGLTYWTKWEQWSKGAGETKCLQYKELWIPSSIVLTDRKDPSVHPPHACTHTHTRPPAPPPRLLCALHACALTVTVLYSHVARSMQIRFTERACTVLQTHRDMVILGDHYSPLKFRIAGGAQMDFYLSVITSLRSEL